jgi:pSer/pThr/pTyr-binding forkhead associated (FHA) protein
MIERNEVLVGRSAECDIIIDDVTVSRRHARISRKGMDLWIFDLDSLNGTYVNKKRIETAMLKNKDEIQIGKYKFIFITGS